MNPQPHKWRSDARTPRSRLLVLLSRIEQWEDIADSADSYLVGEELLLDIKQCLASIVEDPHYA